MLQITMLTVGQLPKGPMSELGDDFAKRLSKFARLERKSVKSTERLISAVPKDSRKIVLDITGQKMSSEDFANKLSGWIDQGQKLTFIIGGPHGPGDNIKAEADLLLSLSPMTTTHDLAQIFFLEQLYRAFTIVKGMTYHY